VNWFDDAGVVAQLPIEYRGLALYSRAYRRLRPVGEVRGLWRGWVAIASARAALRARTSLLVDVRGVPIAIDLLDPRGMWALQEVAGEDAEFQLLTRLLSPGDSFLDVGANHGAYALFAAKIVGREGRVLAFEPQPRLASLVRRAFSAAGRSESDVIEVACFDRTGRTSFSVPNRQSGSGGVEFAQEAEARAATYSVRTEQLDTLLAHEELPGRLVVKIDVEGSELAVVRGATQTLTTRHPPLLCEINPVTSVRAGFEPRELIAELGSLGYTWFSTPETYPHVVTADRVVLDQQHNLLALTTPPDEAVGS
jgi:FkbM family methyltransferase